MIKSPFPKSVYQKNSQIYKMMANPKRLEILNIIKDQEVSVDVLSQLLGIKKSNTSQHLAVLRSLRLVQTRREEQNVFYRLVDPRIVEPCMIFKSLWQESEFLQI